MIGLDLDLFTAFDVISFRGQIWPKMSVNVWEKYKFDAQ